MAESDGQERSEQASEKRLADARKKGQVARSREFATVIVLVTGSVALLWFGQKLAVALANMMHRLFSFTRDEVFDADALLTIACKALLSIIPSFSLILLLLFVASILGASLIGGFNVSAEAMMPKFNKLNPMSGFKRMFGMQSWVELGKSILKILLLGITTWRLLLNTRDDLAQLSMEAFPQNMIHAVDTLLWFVLLLSCTLILVAAIDVPYQLWNHGKKLMMTKQELKEEYKNSEGNPQIKGRIRQLQREIANRRMMGEVPTADVIVTNPEHFSVALRYQRDKDKAPVVVAKGVDMMAMKIREIANAHDIPIVAAPPLARALYHSAELEQPIPDGLFMAVAQVLAYVFQLRQYQAGRTFRRPVPLPETLPIPDDLQR
ncbi:MAG: flagellar biosynthesis protein FlhB [Plesiomonas sp.]